MSQIDMWQVGFKVFDILICQNLCSLIGAVNENWHVSQEINKVVQVNLTKACTNGFVGHFDMLFLIHHYRTRIDKARNTHVEQ